MVDVRHVHITIDDIRGSFRTQLGELLGVLLLRVEKERRGEKGREVRKMGGERTGQGRKERGETRAEFRKGKGGHAPKMLKVAFLCTFAYGVHYSVVDLNYHYHKH